MKYPVSSRLAAGLSALLMFSTARAETATNAVSDMAPRPQILIDIRILEMPAAAVKELFGKKGLVPGNAVEEDLLARIEKMKGVDLLSAPRVVTRAGESAQIKVGQEQSFATSFRVVETNGVWEPVFKTVELGISATVVATPYPNDPARLRGAAEMSFSQLKSVSEQTVTPPGNQGTFKLQSPVVETRALTASFDVNNGKTIVLGGVERSDKGDTKSTVVLFRASVIPRLP